MSSKVSKWKQKYIDTIDNPFSFHPYIERRVVVMVWMMMVVVVMSVMEIMLMMTEESTHTATAQPRLMVIFIVKLCADIICMVISLGVTIRTWVS